ncbi:MAG: radical SAM protein, partial [Planctomycetes bacterium]|nr:radical SAM protein [Planctomycetota bacterium]
IERGELSGLDVRVELIDEIVSRVDPRRVSRRFRRPGTKVVVGLVGVQSNQFPRAQDLARQFKAEGCDVMIGGFHVSGAVALAPTMPPECQETIDAGVTLVLGEVEDRWAGLLRDAASDRLQPVYNFLDDLPDLSDKPVPHTSASIQGRFALKNSGTIDAGRGCPFNCSFCTIINVQGRKMRCRSAAHILAQIRENYYLRGRRKGVRHYFFTDDNFARNPAWEEIFDGLIELREERGMAIDFMMQVDTMAPRIPHFVEKAARAGCVQVFIGMEAIRDDNLQAGGKPQNRSSEYREMVARWHGAGVVCHVGYIIGFPFDTYERVMEDVRTLRDELEVEQASFFILTPLPGSRDHQQAVQTGVPMDPDYNNFDAFHVTTPHPRMSRQELERAFRDVWTEFYSYEHMRKSLLRQNPHTYWGVLKNLIWYRAGMAEGAHPMVTGFFRLKTRTERRRTFALEGRLRFFRRRVRDITYILGEYTKIFLLMQELWLKTRIRRDEYAFLGDLRKLASRSTQEAKLNWTRVHAVMAERLAGARGTVGARVTVARSTTVERVEAMRSTMGVRAAALGASIGGRAGAMRNSVEVSLAQAGRTLSLRAAALQQGLGDLRLKYLPPMKHPSRLGQVVSRLNFLSMQRVETRGEVLGYWQQTWSRWRRLQFWRVNPITFTRHVVRDTRHAVIFLFAMVLERY